ncbi:MAG: hypothetical protein N2053_07405 [Chitinispirillaceae bacterium]|nr:hypothetical protein [Chitinispirillaceae bacterium]
MISKKIESKIKNLNESEIKKRIEETTRDFTFDLQGKCLRKAIKQHDALFVGIIFFSFVLCLILFSFIVTKVYWLLLPLFFCGLTVAFLIISTIQSIMYYYEKELIKTNYIPHTGKIVKITEDEKIGFTFIEYEYLYKGEKYYGSFEENIDLCKNLFLDMEIPIKIFRYKPMLSDVNRAKFIKLINIQSNNKED